MNSPEIERLKHVDAMMKMFYLDHWTLDCRKLCCIYRTRGPVSSTNKLQRYENMEREHTDQDRLKRCINQQPRWRTFLDPDPNRQIVNIYLTFEKLKIWTMIRYLITLRNNLIFLRHYNSRVGTKMFSDEIIWCLDLLPNTIDDVFFWWRRGGGGLPSTQQNGAWGPELIHQPS